MPFFKQPAPQVPRSRKDKKCPLIPGNSGRVTLVRSIAYPSVTDNAFRHGRRLSLCQTRVCSSLSVLPFQIALPSRYAACYNAAMISLDGIEALAEQLIEGTFGRLFGLPLHPSEILRRLVRAMEDGQQVGADGQVILPNHYWVSLSPADHATLGDRVQLLAAELAHCLRQVAERDGNRFAGPLVIALEAAPHLTDGQAEVWAECSSLAEPHTNTRAILPVELSGDTRAWSLHLGERVYRLGERTLSLGRALSNDIILQDARVSRRHAQLRWQNGRYYVSDVGSRLGVAVNRRPLAPGEEVPLTDGDQLSLGGLTLTVRCGPDRSADETAPLPPMP